MGEPEHFNEGVTAYLHPRLLLRVVVKSLLVLKESNCSPAGYWKKKKEVWAQEAWVFFLSCPEGLLPSLWGSGCLVISGRLEEVAYLSCSDSAPGDNPVPGAPVNRTILWGLPGHSLTPDLSEPHCHVDLH